MAAKSGFVLKHMLKTADYCIRHGDYKKAFEGYSNLTQIALPDVETSKTAEECCAQAYYNLGVLYAQGQGVPRNYLQATLTFRLSEMLGNTDAHQLRLKSLMDYFNENIDAITPEMLYERAVVYAQRIKMSSETEVFQPLLDLANYYMQQERYGEAAKYMRVMAEYARNSDAQNILGVLFLNGAGVEKCDYAALYWFHKAELQGNISAAKDRTGIFNAYRSNCSKAEFDKVMDTIISSCRNGSRYIPKDDAEAEYWAGMKKSGD